MKKKNYFHPMSVFLVLVLSATLITGFAAGGLTPISNVVLNDQIKFKLNGLPVIPVGDDGSPVLPITYKNTTYMPLRALGYLLGLGVDYEGASQTILLTSTTTKTAPRAQATTKTNKMIPISGAVLNGDLKFQLDGVASVPKGDDGIAVLPISYNGTTYLPLRATANLLALGISYESTTATVLLTRGSQYVDDQGNTVNVPSGTKAFADQVVSFAMGSPAPLNEKFREPKEALGEPNYSGFTNNSATMSGIVSLGGGGTIVLEFTKVYIIDGPGPDFHVFEVGPAVESMSLEISSDGVTWIKLGTISGGTASVDLSGKVSTADKFSYIKLTDLKSSASGEWPGADLDAVGALNTIIK